jgi:hypothetical protein
MTHVGSSVLSSKAPSPKPADLSLSTLDVSRELRSLPLVLVKDHDVEKSEMWNVSLTLSGPVSLSRQSRPEVKVRQGVPALSLTAFAVHSARSPARTFSCDSMEERLVFSSDIELESSDSSSFSFSSTAETRKVNNPGSVRSDRSAFPASLGLKHQSKGML